MTSHVAFTAVGEILITTSEHVDNTIKAGCCFFVLFFVKLFFSPFTIIIVVRIFTVYFPFQPSEVCLLKKSTNENTTKPEVFPLCVLPDYNNMSSEGFNHGFNSNK